MENGALTTLVKLLGQLADHKARYKIILPDGAIFESADFAPPQEKMKQERLYKRGETRAYYLPFFKNIKDNTLVSIPVDRFDGRILASNIVSFLHHAIGSKNYAANYRKESGVIDVVVSNAEALKNTNSPA